MAFELEKELGEEDEELCFFIVGWLATAKVHEQLGLGAAPFSQVVRTWSASFIAPAAMDAFLPLQFVLRGVSG